MIQKFALFNIKYGETVEVIEMDDALLAPDAGVVDAESMTLKPLNHGADYTLIPCDDGIVVALTRLQKAYLDLTTQKCTQHSTWVGRIDKLISSVEALFAKHNYKVVESAQDMQYILDPPDSDWEPKTVEREPFLELLEDFRSKTAQSENNSDLSGK